MIVYMSAHVTFAHLVHPCAGIQLVAAHHKAIFAWRRVTIPYIHACENAPCSPVHVDIDIEAAPLHAVVEVAARAALAKVNAVGVALQDLLNDCVKRNGLAIPSKRGQKRE